MIGFTFAQPFLITSAIQNLERIDTPDGRNFGYGLIGATFLIYFGLAVSIHEAVKNFPLN
jgi:ATP-binding cassette subfamily C (CFTR/MRP) protein 1